MTARLTTSSQSNSNSVANMAVGTVVADATTAADEVFTVGFNPRHIVFVDRTNRIMLEWWEGMAANSAIRTVAAGTRTLDVSSGITIGTALLGTLGQFTVKAADLPASASCSWMAFG